MYFLFLSSCYIEMSFQYTSLSPPTLTLCGAIGNEVVFLISFTDSLLFVHGNDSVY